MKIEITKEQDEMCKEVLKSSSDKITMIKDLSVGMLATVNGSIVKVQYFTYLIIIIIQLL